MAFERRKLVRFAHCDPAGIVFYPRYVELVNEVVEDWFEAALGVGFRELHESRGLGIPAVRLELEFVAPSRYGERLVFHLEVTKLGRTSVTLAISAACGEDPRLRARLTVVLVSIGTRRPVPLDEGWRTRLAPYLAR